MRIDTPFYKGCSCNILSWEEIVVQNDEYYENKTVIYFHCCECGEDFAVIDYYSNEILHIKQECNIVT